MTFAEIRHVISTALCPCCGRRGDHDFNGDRQDATLCCPTCGTHFDACYVCPKCGDAKASDADTCRDCLS